jgi:hypothetical protein
MPLVVVELILGVTPVTPSFLTKSRSELKKNYDRLLKYGILRPSQSPWNTLLLPVQNPGTEDFRPVQDLCVVNSATVTLHPVVPNPYMLLGFAPAEAKFFACLDLKDAFFCIHLAPQSQPIFAFQWENPNTGEKGQLEPIATRLQEFFYYFWNCPGV